MAKASNPVVSGWIRYYGRFYISQLFDLLLRLELRLTRWARRKYKDLRGHRRRSRTFIRRMRQAKPGLFVYWQAL